MVSTSAPCFSRYSYWGGGISTPPDSPHAAAQFMRESSLQYDGCIIPELDIYAIPSSEGMCRLYLRNNCTLPIGTTINFWLICVFVCFILGALIKEIYFVALIDVLTHYGVKKQAAKAAKSVKYGSNVDGISTCDPEVYGRRFLEFLSKAIE